MRTLQIIILIAFFGFVACSKKTTTTIIPLESVGNLGDRGVIYSLPKTNLKIKVEATQTSIIPGPYAQFAKKYLGISNAPTTPRNFWEISDVGIATYEEPDMNSLYVIEPAKDFSIDYLTLTKKGLIIPISFASFYGPEQGTSIKMEYGKETEFTDLSHIPFIASERTTHYSRVFQDSTYVRVPVHRTVVVEKSIEDKAREAADFIFSLRKRRFELISGDADFLVEGRAVKTIFDEISRLEEEYLSLFIGKSTQTKKTYLMDYSPASESETASILFRFSATRGVLPASDLSGSPVLISINVDSNWRNIQLFNQLSLEEAAVKPNAIYYRLPVPATIKISDSNTEFFKQRITINQLGPIVRMPSRFVISSERIVFPKNEEK